MPTRGILRLSAVDLPAPSTGALLWGTSPEVREGEGGEGGKRQQTLETGLVLSAIRVLAGSHCASPVFHPLGLLLPALTAGFQANFPSRRHVSCRSKGDGRERIASYLAYRVALPTPG